VLDEDGYGRYMGRNKDMIVKVGDKIFPVELEQFFVNHPDVLEAAVSLQCKDNSVKWLNSRQVTRLRHNQVQPAPSFMVPKNSLFQNTLCSGHRCTYVHHLA
jgi:long-subunit acyl-CoA synthetase (AMP-forming)